MQLIPVDNIIDILSWLDDDERQLYRVVSKQFSQAVRAIRVNFTNLAARLNMCEAYTLGVALNHTTRDVARIAGKYGSTNILKLHIDAGNHVMMAWYAAAKNNRFDVVKWLHDNGRSWDHHICGEFAAIAGRKDVLEWIREVRGEFHCGVTEVAATFGHIHILEWLNAKQSTYIYEAAALGGRVNVLEWLECKKPIVDTSVCRAAASGGHVTTLEWLRTNGFAWDAEAMNTAARNGHLDAVKYLHLHSCPYSEEVNYNAAISQNLEVYRWVAENIVPTDRRSVMYARRYLASDILDWIAAEGKEYVEPDPEDYTYGHYSGHY
jgi:hypothetical protein